jgi:hypothetical protein
MVDYTRIDRFLHQIALGSNAVVEVSFDLENHLFSAAPPRHDAIYVTGLARAGTTTLMRGLYQSGEFSSLTYDDMPFVLAPNLWQKISRIQQKKRISKERAHGDGIYVDFDSPEALEEVFWRVHCGSLYIRDEHLCTHKVDPETVLALKRYQNNVCYKYGKPRYLAKNNNHILRILSLAEALPDTRFLILFRDPVSQARSLLKQHNKFIDADTFTRCYMTWLAHHEFGATHRPFQFFEHGKLNADASDLQYWIDRWTDAYAYLLDVLEENLPNLIPVSYEKLCNEPDYWGWLCYRLNIQYKPSPFRRLAEASHKEQNFNIDRSCAIYQKLMKISTRVTCT